MTTPSFLARPEWAVGEKLKLPPTPGKLRMPSSAARTLEIDQHEPDEAVAHALEVLRAAGV